MSVFKNVDPSLVVLGGAVTALAGAMALAIWSSNASAAEEAAYRATARHIETDRFDEIALASGEVRIRDGFGGPAGGRASLAAENLGECFRLASNAATLSETGAVNFTCQSGSYIVTGVALPDDRFVVEVPTDRINLRAQLGVPSPTNG